MAVSVYISTYATTENRRQSNYQGNWKIKPLTNKIIVMRYSLQNLIPLVGPNIGTQYWDPLLEVIII